MSGTASSSPTMLSPASSNNRSRRMVESYRTILSLAARETQSQVGATFDLSPVMEAVVEAAGITSCSSSATLDIDAMEQPVWTPIVPSAPTASSSASDDAAADVGPGSPLIDVSTVITRADVVKKRRKLENGGEDSEEDNSSLGDSSKDTECDNPVDELDIDLVIQPEIAPKLDDTVALANFMSDSDPLDSPDGLNVHAPLAPLVRFRTLSDGSPITPILSDGPRMLIADDSYTVRRFMQRTFEQRGYSVDVANNGWHAFAQMQTHLYDFVFLDIEMPGMNGYRCAQALRRWETLVEREERQFICALTSHSNSSERELGLGIGMDLFEAKPARPKRLLGIVEHAMKAARGDVNATAAIAAAANAIACGAIDIDQAYDPLITADFGQDAAAEMATLKEYEEGADSPFAWLKVRVEVKTKKGDYKCESTEGKVVFEKVPRRRLRAPNEQQPEILEAGALVDVAIQGSWKAATVIAHETGSTYTLSIEGFQGSISVPRENILATPVPVVPVTPV